MLAVGRQVLEIAYHLLKQPTTYRELGTDYFDRVCGQLLILLENQQFATDGFINCSVSSVNARQ